MSSFHIPGIALLHSRTIYAGLGSNGLFDRQWQGDTESIGTILRRAASFLYY